MNRIELSGKSQGKGRNGYFQLHGVDLMELRTDPDDQVLHFDFYPRRRVNWVGPARLLLTVEDDRADLCREVATRTGWRAIAAESCTRFPPELHIDWR